MASQCKKGCVSKAVGDETSQRNRKPRRGMKLKRTNVRVRRVQEGMNEIKREQESIRRGQTQVRQKFEALQFECEQLRKETDLVTKQSFNTQLRLALMFQILAARQSNDFNKASILTQLLRGAVSLAEDDETIGSELQLLSAAVKALLTAASSCFELETETL